LQIHVCTTGGRPNRKTVVGCSCAAGPPETGRRVDSIWIHPPYRSFAARCHMTVFHVALVSGSTRRDRKKYCMACHDCRDFKTEFPACCALRWLKYPLAQVMHLLFVFLQSFYVCLQQTEPRGDALGGETVRRQPVCVHLGLHVLRWLERCRSRVTLGLCCITHIKCQASVDAYVPSFAPQSVDNNQLLLISSTIEQLYRLQHCYNDHFRLKNSSASAVRHV
jgi:hypothetical protein